MEGGRDSIRRAGNELLRPLNPWTPKVHGFLRYLETQGFTNVPKVLRIDRQDEVLSWVEGCCSNYPLSGDAASDETLMSAALLLRQYHDVSANYARTAPTEGWMLSAVNPIEVMCHGDFAPYNVVLNGSDAVGIIDFDTLHPGSRLSDVAYAVYRWAPLKNPRNPDSMGDLASQVRRTKVFCDSYGLKAPERTRLVISMIERLNALVDFMGKAADKGDKTFSAHIAEGHLDAYLDDIEYLTINRDVIVLGVL
ncbi:aminoglycoside phosphotransferase family protein [Parasalinivibrio latis]|uniref:phosphotransferase n=1 Tax=Parasalinivibrio latis TaxID=2952610 RepID=UPI0030E24F9F